MSVALMPLPVPISTCRVVGDRASAWQDCRQVECSKRLAGECNAEHQCEIVYALNEHRCMSGRSNFGSMAVKGNQ
jgi:hypothetical protein